MDENRNRVERFLVVHGAGPAWAIRAAHVARFTTLAQWQGPAPLTAEWSESAVTPLTTRCLMVFRTSRGEHAIHITGTVTPQDVEATKVSALPLQCQPVTAAALVVSAIAIEGDTALFLIVEPTTTLGG